MSLSMSMSMSTPTPSPTTSSTTTTTTTLASKLESMLKTNLKFPTFLPSNRTTSLWWSLVPKMGTYNVQVVVEDNEPEDRLLGRFRREVFRAGVIQESKRRRFFENSQQKKKRKSREAAKKYRARRPRPKVLTQEIVEIPKKATYNSDEDDWDLPAGDLPY